MNNKHKIFNRQAEPAIYIRKFLGVIMYIGETQDWRKGRPFRESDDPKMLNSEFLSKFVENNPDKDFDPYRYSIGNWDQVRMLPASSDPKRRKYWEAVLITKYKPLTQTNTIWKYYTTIKKNINITEVQKETAEIHKEAVMKMSKNNNKKLERHYKFQILEGMNNLITLKKENKEHEQKNS